ncbi:MAG: DinB family protein, partial [Gemmatimonadales bacterium]|nr:DinB family protein [Gemmatimonadales bacterium]
MQTDDILTLVAYNQWANQRLLSAVRDLLPSEFTRALGTSFGSVKGTVVHILDGEWHWLQLWQSKPRNKRPVPEDFADAAAVAEAFPELEQGQREFVNGL